jgi:pilus assembly protein FimV
LLVLAAGLMMRRRIRRTRHVMATNAAADSARPLSEAIKTGADIPSPPVQSSSVPPSSGSEVSRTLRPFPSEAISALNGLALSLPPRIETAETAETVETVETVETAMAKAEETRAGERPSGYGGTAAALPVSPTTQPVAASEIAARQAVQQFEPQPPRSAGVIEAGIEADIAGGASVAGLGAARFGAFHPGFDLDLPASASMPPMSALAPRDKLKLAAQYIECDDVVRASALLDEVIESNDEIASTEARAMLSALASRS